MKRLLDIIGQNKYFLLFILIFAYVQSIYFRILVRETINVYIFTPEAAIATLISVSILFLIILYFIKRWQKSAIFTTKELLKIFTSSILVYILIMNLNGLILTFIFDTFERNFNQKTFLLTTFTNLLNGFIYGSFFLAYYYYQKNKENQKKIILYNQAISESKINQLKTQLNPHFLFNNLNVLDQLIDEDKNKASDFLNEFSEIYRYVLQATDKKIVAIEDELAFAKSYFGLMQHKYGTAYQLEVIQERKTNGNIVPLTLQLLLENAFQHNLGTENNPVFIKIEISDKLMVSNNIREKRNPKTTSGRALKNLKEQYDLLSKQNIEIHHSNEKFTVILPLIPQEND